MAIAVVSDAYLVASDTDLPLDHKELWRADPTTVCLAQSDGWLPAFWLFCFGSDFPVEVPLPPDARVGLGSGVDAARRRLASRDALARQLFPAYQVVWDRWCGRVESAGRRYLKMDAFGIADAAPEDYNRLVRDALAWFDTHSPQE